MGKRDNRAPKIQKVAVVSSQIPTQSGTEEGNANSMDSGTVELTVDDNQGEKDKPIVQLPLEQTETNEQQDATDTIIVQIKPASNGHIDNDCTMCNAVIRRNAHALKCKQCNHNFHQKCMKMPPAEYQKWNNSSNTWLCKSCLGLDAEAPNLKWGSMQGYQDIQDKIMEVYAQIVTWQKNIFDTPKGNIGKDFIKELTDIIHLFNTKSKWEPIALHLVNIFIPLMLQKPSAKSKNKDHIRYLKKRLVWWKEGKVDELLSECREIQRLIKERNEKKRPEKSLIKGFTNLMMEGKVKQAIKLIDADSQVTGVHQLTERIRNAL